MIEEVVDYIDDKDGGAELLCMIDPIDGTRWKTFVEKADVSHETVSKRLTEGVELGLLEKEAISGERGTSHAYVLTSKGGFVRYLLEESGAAGTYSLIQAYQERVEQEVDEAAEMLEEREDEFDDSFKTGLRFDTVREREQGLERYKPDEDSDE